MATINKIKPIFNVGDWVANELGDAWHIDSFDAKNYQVSNGKGNYNYFPISKQDEMHLWTIKDAKDGDILSVEPVGGYQFPFVAIYKNRGLDFFSSYCFIGLNGKFYEGETGHALDEIHPATKGQREILYSKMKEACYVWDGEKKELKKIKVKEINFEKEVKLWIDENTCNGYCSASIYDTAEHFYELGLKSQKGE